MVEIPEASDEGKEMDRLIGCINLKLLLKSLPKRQRMALKLQLQGYTYAEIGGKMKIKPNTVHNYLTIGKRKLKEIIKSSPL